MVARATEDRRVMKELKEPVLKRVFDFTLALIGLILSLPLWILIGLLIWFDDGSPVLFVQQRVGKHGRGFRLLKFRSMIAEADQKFGPMQAHENDPRITRVGRMLRATAMDELPQLWNILKGEMSFVGPRALLPEEIEVDPGSSCRRIEEVPGYQLRIAMRPGLTGLAQVFARRDLSRQKKFRYDALYVKNQSLWLDVRLILLSVWITFQGRWEDRSRGARRDHAVEEGDR
jgi:lipopolysaccharide/colanic/teichoic acid biosynthesis glycosyltransferase